MIDGSTIVSTVAAGLGAYAALSQMFIGRENARRDQDIALLKKQTDLFWNMVEQHMTTVLHSPHTPALDVLLEKYQSRIPLTHEEAQELYSKLVFLINNPDESQGNRAGAVFLLAALDVRYNLDESINSNQ